MAELLTIYESSNLMEAELVRSLLDANGVDSELIGDHTRHFRIIMGDPDAAVQVVIDSDDAEKVQELFEAYLEEFNGFPINAWRPKRGDEVAE